MGEVKPRSLALCFLFACAGPARAKIGETRALIEARMGQPTGEKDGRQVYEKDGFRVIVQYRDGVSVLERVSAMREGEPLADGVRDTLLTAYGAGQTWNAVADRDEWLRVDKKVAAAVEASTSITFVDLSFAAQAKAQKSKEDEARVASAFGPLPTPVPTPTPQATPVRPTYTPKPPYPYQARSGHVEGAGAVRVIFGESGRPSSVTVVQTTGSELLDGNTVQWAQEHWSGPPNTALTVPIRYMLD